ncbi:MAG: energy transducer TonB [Thermoguttaceae bacterium]|jgi:protein TonB|nr:energy transducer TonB [Thermoguttaceae bacterium]
MHVCHLDHRRTRRPRRTLCGCGWLASLLLHCAAAAVAWAVTAPVWHEHSALIGQNTRVELMATMAHSELGRAEPAPEEMALPVRILPAEAQIARRHFHMESTIVSEPTPFELALVEQILSQPHMARPSREPGRPTIEPPPSGVIARQPAAPPLQNQPGTADRPLPELIQSLPPVYPQVAIQRRWQGTVLLRLGITTEGRVGQVEILSSSGYDVLDGEAVRAVRAWRFVPAIRDGHPVSSFVRLPVRFELPVM